METPQSKGGRMRAENLSAEERSRIASDAANTKWERQAQAALVLPETDSADVDLEGFGFAKEWDEVPWTFEKLILRRFETERGNYIALTIPLKDTNVDILSGPEKEMFEILGLATSAFFGSPGYSRPHPLGKLAGPKKMQKANSVTVNRVTMEDSAWTIIKLVWGGSSVWEIYLPLTQANIAHLSEAVRCIVAPKVDFW